MKKFSLLVLALFITLFTLVSCQGGNNQATSSGDIPQSNSKGSQSHTHVYDEWEIVNEPTETEKGSAQRSCTICDDVEEMELPALSSESYDITAQTEDCYSTYKLKTNKNISFNVETHTGEIFCEGCGLDLTTDLFWENLENSNNYESFTFNLENFTLNLETTKINIKDANLEIAFDEEGNFSRALGYVTKISEELNDQNEPIETTYYFDFEDMVLYRASQIKGSNIRYASPINFKKEAQEINTLASLEETTTTLNREKIIDLLYKLTNVKKENDNLIISIDWNKIKNYNDMLYRNSINDLFMMATYTDLKGTINTSVETLSQLTLTTLALMLDESITNIETMINSYLALIPEGAIPQELTTLTALIKHILIQTGKFEASKFENVTNIKELLLALDPSKEENKIYIGDIILNMLQITKDDTETYPEAIKRYLATQLDLIVGQFGIDSNAILELFSEKIDPILNNLPYNLTITDLVNMLDGLGVFEQINILEQQVNVLLSMINQVFPLDTSNITNFIKNILIKLNKYQESELENVSDLKSLIIALDKSTPTDPDTLDEIIVRLFNIEVKDNETAKVALANKINSYLDKTVYDYIVEIEYFKNKNVTPLTAYTLINNMIESYLSTVTTLSATIGEDGLFKGIDIKAEFLELFNCNLKIEANNHISMIDIRVS